MRSSEKRKIKKQALELTEAINTRTMRTARELGRHADRISKCEDRLLDIERYIEALHPTLHLAMPSLEPLKVWAEREKKREEQREMIENAGQEEGEESHTPDG